MSVSTFTSPNPTTQLVTEYLSSLDGDVAVMSQVAAAFAPHQSVPANLTVSVDPGLVFNGSTLTEIPVQITATITPPTVSSRIDRVVINRATGAIDLIDGAESTTPVPPAIPFGFAPVARISLDASSATVTNAMIDDERVLLPIGVSTGNGGLLNVQTFTSSGIYIPTPGTNSIIVEVQGAGGSGGSVAATSASQVNAGSGGGAGSYAKSLLTNGFSGISVTVGQGGAAPAAGARKDGNPGGVSSFGEIIIAPGGNGGNGSDVVTDTAILDGSRPNVAATGGNIVNAAGQPSTFSASANGSRAVGGTGGASFFGGGGGGRGLDFGGSGPGFPAISPGAGGGGACALNSASAASGGVGADGIVIIHEYA